MRFHTDFDIKLRLSIRVSQEDLTNQFKKVDPLVYHFVAELAPDAQLGCVLRGAELLLILIMVNPVNSLYDVFIQAEQSVHEHDRSF